VNDLVIRPIRFMEFTEEIKREIWNKGIIDDKYPSERVRKDACGAFILYEDFGNRNSIFGWEFDHIFPASKLREKGIAEELIDNPVNLRPLNWKNNASKGSSYPFYTACLVADDKNATNIESNVGKVVNQKVQNELKSLFKLED